MIKEPAKRQLIRTKNREPPAWVRWVRLKRAYRRLPKGNRLAWVNKQARAQGISYGQLAHKLDIARRKTG